jgi:hypothetical protein
MRKTNKQQQQQQQQTNNAKAMQKQHLSLTR